MSGWKRNAVVFILAALMCGAFLWGLYRERQLSERLFILNPTDDRRVQTLPLNRAGSIIAINPESRSVLLETGGEALSRTQFDIEVPESASIIRRDGIREGTMVIGARDERGLSFADIRTPSFATVLFAPDSVGRLKASIVIFGDLPFSF